MCWATHLVIQKRHPKRNTSSNSKVSTFGLRSAAALETEKIFPLWTSLTENFRWTMVFFQSQQFIKLLKR